MRTASGRLLSLTAALVWAASTGGMVGCGGGDSGTGSSPDSSTAGGAGASGAPSGSVNEGGSKATAGSGTAAGSSDPSAGSGAGATGSQISSGNAGSAGTMSSGPVAGSGGGNSVSEDPLVLPVEVKPWAPSERCQTKAKEILATMTRANKAAQMVQADSVKISAAQVGSSGVGSVLSGGGSDPAGGNSAAAWTSMVNSYHQAKNSLNIPLLYGIDAVHGHNNVSGAVIFPHNIGLGCARSAELVREVGRITALEVRGTGMDWTFAPVVAAGRDERWGRTYETYSEDPALSARLGVALIQGLQGTSLANKESVLATAKHFAGDGATELGTDQGNVTLGEAEFQRLAIDQYQPAINAGAGSIMVSFSSISGQKMTGSKKYLTDILKGTMGFKGFLITDWDAIYQLPGGSGGGRPGGMGRAASVTQIAAAVNAGIDMIMENTSYSGVVSTLTSATAEIPDARMDDAVTRILTVKCELGMFEDSYSGTADPELTAKIGSAEHREVARRAVRESVVLLQNEAQALPIPKSAKIHVMGSGADSLSRQCGGWTVDWQGLGIGGMDGAGTGNTTTGTTLLSGIQAIAAGGTVTSGSTVPADAEYVVVVASETPYAEGEGDRTDLSLSACMASDTALLAALPASAKKIVVLLSGRPIILGDSLAQADAWVAAWLPGTEGAGVADVLFGDYNPTGKLSHSWPKTMTQIPINVGDADYESDPPLYPFGYGLSY